MTVLMGWETKAEASSEAATRWISAFDEYFTFRYLECWLESPLETWQQAGLSHLQLLSVCLHGFMWLFESKENVLSVPYCILCLCWCDTYCFLWSVVTTTWSVVSPSVCGPQLQVFYNNVISVIGVWSPKMPRVFSRNLRSVYDATVFVQVSPSPVKVLSLSLPYVWVCRPFVLRCIKM